MSSPNPSRSAVKSTALKGRAVAACIADLEKVATAGGNCQKVQSSPPAAQALADLAAKADVARAALASKLAARTAVQAASKVLAIAFSEAAGALRFYEAGVRSIAGGDAAIISDAGLLVGAHPMPAALGNVVEVIGEPGRLPGQAVLRWARVPGATTYLVEVSFSPDSPNGPFLSLSPGTSRRRVVTAPAPEAQLLARVAALDGSGARSEWSPTILVTAR